MYKLNLPDVDFNLRKEDSKVWIFDVIRKKFILLTPEEWVRQHFIHYMLNQLNYPRALVKIEGGLSYNQRQKRSDIVVYDRNGKPWMVVECKSPEITLNSQTLMQASAYNATLKASYVAITNGMVHYCARTDWDNNQTEILKDMPLFG